MKAFFCELIFSCVGIAPAAPLVEDLTYGTVLYEYYQGDYQAALLNTLVAEDQNRRGEQPIRFDLAKGSFAFNDGMYALAENVFANVDEAELTDLDRLRLGFHLSREFYRRRDWPRLAEELGKIDLGKTWLGRVKFHPEVEFMRAELATVSGDHQSARALLDQLDEKDPLRAYGLFNLGVAQNEAGALADAEATFGKLVDMKVDTDEAFDLIQRAKLAIAFLKKNQGKTTEAETVLDALPVDSRYRDVALATYGGLAMNTENYELAARIWLTLQNQDYWNPSTATARLGFPVSLEQLASMDMALTQYRSAEKSFEARLVKLNQLSEEAADPAWVRGLLNVFSAPDRDGDAVDAVVDHWRDQLGHTDWLEWLSAEEVHQVLGDWRHLMDERVWLGTLPERMTALEAVGGERKRRAVEARRMLNDDGLLARHAELIEQVNQLEGRINVVHGTRPVPELDWMLALATDEERELLLELDNMRATVAAGVEAGGQGRWLDRIGRLRGMVFWEIANTRAARIRGVRKTLSESRNVLADIETRVERVQQAEANFVAGAETNYLLFADRAQLLTARIDAAIADREAVLAREIRRGMEREAQQVEQYLLVTRIAIARATDQLGMNADQAQ